VLAQGLLQELGASVETQAAVLPETETLDGAPKENEVDSRADWSSHRGWTRSAG